VCPGRELGISSTFHSLICMYECLRDCRPTALVCTRYSNLCTRTSVSDYRLTVLHCISPFHIPWPSHRISYDTHMNGPDPLLSDHMQCAVPCPVCGKGGLILKSSLVSVTFPGPQATLPMGLASLCFSHSVTACLA